MFRLYYPKKKRGALASGSDSGPDIGDATKKVAKLIPIEIVTGYAALVSASMAVRWEYLRQPIIWICFAICLVLTPIYLNSVAEAGKPKRNQIIVGTAAFPIWAYLISGSQMVPGFFDPGLATIVALVFSLATAPIPMNR